MVQEDCDELIGQDRLLQYDIGLHSRSEELLGGEDLNGARTTDIRRIEIALLSQSDCNELSGSNDSRMGHRNR